jgi:two-component system LytT family sensor kinase
VQTLLIEGDGKRRIAGKIDMTLRRFGFNALLILIAVNLMALGELIHALMMMNWRPGTTMGQMFFTQLASAACFGILIPPIVWFARRYPLVGEKWWRHILPVALVGVFVCMLHPALYTGLDRLIGDVLGPHYSFHYRYGYAFVRGHPETPFWHVWWYVLTYYFTSLVFFYACIVAFVSARQYYRLLRKSELDRMRLESGLAQARLNLLTMQLHPHFLFNTLNSISELMYEDVAAAERMVARLSELLRLSPLGKELEYLGVYLEIEKIRFQGRLLLDFEIAPEAGRCPVPFLILQPLVENAVRHGIARLRQPGRIRLRACHHDGRLELEIRNDGPSDGAKIAAEGLGLRNTRDRLNALYGQDYSFEYGSVPEGGWRVLLRIPGSQEESQDVDC